MKPHNIIFAKKPQTIENSKVLGWPKYLSKSVNAYLIFIKLKLLSSIDFHVFMFCTRYSLVLFFTRYICACFFVKYSSDNEVDFF